MSRKLLVIIGVGFLSLGAQACSDPSSAYIGQVCTFTQNWCPKGFVRADGSALNISQYAALYSLMGDAFSEKKQAGTFNVPDLRGRVVLGTGKAGGLSNVEIGEKNGVESVTLAVKNLPPHTHPVTAGNLKITASKSVGGSNVPIDGGYFAAADTGPDGAPIYSATAPATGNSVQLTGISGSVGSVGEGSAIATRPPYLGLTQCIVVDGLYPQQNQ